MLPWGGIFLVAGTSIGAGTLALPMISATFGFYPSLWIMMGMGLLMIVTGLLSAHLIITHGVSIPVLSGKAFGVIGKGIAGSSILILHWALLAAYMTGASQILSSHIPQKTALLLYVLLLGSLVVSPYVDKANRFVFIIKVFVFGSMIGFLAPHIQTSHLNSASQVNAYHTLIPIFFTSYGFHGSLLSLVSFVGRDWKKVKISIIGGTCVTILFYGLWQLCTLGVLPTTENYSNIALFLDAICSNVRSQSLLSLAPLFSFLAISTSFIGVGLGQYHYLKEILPRQKTSFVVLLTFLLPVAVALFYPDAFIKALGFAAIALSLLAVVLPALLIRFYNKTSPVFLWGGLVALGLGIIIIECFL